MTKKKFLTLLLCLVLIVSVTLPTTLALSSDSDGASDEVSLTPEEPGAEGEEGEEPEPYDGPIDQELPENPEDPENPENPDEPVCTCDPQPEEGEPHQLDCPLYEEPEAQDSNHIPTCFDGCEDPFCTCPCHLFDRIMACMTIEEAEAIIEAASEEALALLTEEQIARIEAHLTALMPEPLPPITIEESEPPVESEIYSPTVNFTYVAPFGEPVSGGR